MIMIILKRIQRKLFRLQSIFRWTIFNSLFISWSSFRFIEKLCREDKVPICPLSPPPIPPQFHLLLTSCISVVRWLSSKSHSDTLLLTKAHGLEITLWIVQRYWSWRMWIVTWSLAVGHNVMYPPLQSHAEWFRCPPKALRSTCSSFLPFLVLLANIDFFFSLSLWFWHFQTVTELES